MIFTEKSLKKVFEHDKVTLSSQSLRWLLIETRNNFILFIFSLCQTKFLEKNSSGDFLSVNFSDGGLVSTLSASHRRVSAQQLKFGYTDSDTVFVLSRDWRTKHHHLDLYHLPTNCKLKGNLSRMIIREKNSNIYFLFRRWLDHQLGRRCCNWQMLFSPGRNSRQRDWRFLLQWYLSIPRYLILH